MRFDMRLTRPVQVLVSFPFMKVSSWLCHVVNVWRPVDTETHMSLPVWIMPVKCGPFHTCRSQCWAQFCSGKCDERPRMSWDSGQFLPISFGELHFSVPPSHSGHASGCEQVQTFTKLVSHTRKLVKSKGFLGCLARYGSSTEDQGRPTTVRTDSEKKPWNREAFSGLHCAVCWVLTDLLRWMPICCNSLRNRSKLAKFPGWIQLSLAPSNSVACIQGRRRCCRSSWFWEIHMLSHLNGTGSQEIEGQLQITIVFSIRRKLLFLQMWYFTGSQGSWSYKTADNGLMNIYVLVINTNRISQSRKAAECQIGERNWKHQKHQTIKADMGIAKTVVWTDKSSKHLAIHCKMQQCTWDRFICCQKYQ